MYKLAEWIKKLLIFALIFHISRGLFISCALDNNPKKAQHYLCQEEEWSSESLTRPRSCCFTADSIPGNACWLFTHCSLHTIMLLPLPLALTRMPTSAPCLLHTCCIWAIQAPCDTVVKGCSNFSTIDYCLSFWSWLMIPVESAEDKSSLKLTESKEERP